MAAAMVARTDTAAQVIDLHEVHALAQEISEEEGIGRRAALVLADLHMSELAAYAREWDEAAEAHRAALVERCPVCGSEIVGQQYYVGGRGYMYFDVCSGDGSHFSRPAR